MKTETAQPKQSSVSAFLGEAAPASPEATVRVEITGTPQKVQGAIAKLARKGGAGKRPGAMGAPPKPEGGEGPGGGDDDGPPAPPRKGPPRGEDDPDVKERALDVVESLIQEEPTAPAAKK